MNQAEWLDKYTFSHTHFQDINRLVELKKEQSTTISLGLPTLNVESSLPKILETIKTALYEEHPLLDEIAIIDSHSKDRTVEIAKDYGVDVFYDDEIVPSLGTAKGKGEALWKSIGALSGDLIVWIDSDIENIHPRFVYGILGPLLAHPEIGYVKGFYQRPIKSSGQLRETGGGRVTEIFARPMLNMFYPQLAGFVQPLSGEYGGRREILESIPFFTGYAVETALLIQIERQFGIESMAQVDLERRVHHNQPTKALGRMAFEILQALLKLLEEDDKIKVASDLNPLLKQLQRRNGEYHFTDYKPNVIKRPPMKEAKEYQDKRKGS